MAASDLACFAWLGDMRKLPHIQPWRDPLGIAGNEKAAPYPTLARLKIGYGQAETVKPEADAPIVKADEAGVLRTFPAGRKTSALLSKGALKSPGEPLDFAHDKLHLKKLGAVVNLRTDSAGYYVVGLADFVKGMPRRRMSERPTCMAPGRTVNTQGQLRTPGIAFSSTSEVKRRFTAPNTFRACKAARMKYLVDPDENGARFIVKKLHVN